MGQGQFDHPVTGIALLELGNLSMESGDYKAAAGYYEEATYTGYDYENYSVIEEAFRNLFLAHIALGDPQALDMALGQAAGWARNLHELRPRCCCRRRKAPRYESKRSRPSPS